MPDGLCVLSSCLCLFPEVVEVAPDGAVTYRQRLFGDLAADLQFREFPFDRQVLEIDFVTYRYTPDEIEFVASEGIAGDVLSFSCDGWQIELLAPRKGSFFVQQAI